METNIFVVNNIIENVDTQNTERIVWIDPEYTYCYTVDMIPKKTHIMKKIINDLEENLVRGTIKKYTDTKRSFRIITANSDKEKEIIKKAKKAIEYIFNTCKEPEVYSDRCARGNAIKKAMLESRLTKPAVYKYFRLYLQGGKSESALLPNYFNSGGKGIPKKSGTKKRGRRNFESEVQDDREGLNVTDKDKKIILKVVEKYYLNEKETPLSEVYRLMKQEYYSEIVTENGKEIKRSLPYYKIITMQEFRYWCKALKDVVEIIKRRKGTTDFENNYKEITSDSRFDSFGSGYFAQADASSFKVEILNRMRNKNVGKPTVYYIVDGFSTMIEGLSVGIGKPSWDGLSSAIFNIVENKVEFCARYGLNIDKNKWPTTKLPRVLVTDKGPEFSGNLLNYCVENLGMTVSNTPPRRPRYKPTVEQSFNVSAIKARTWFTGTSKHKFRRRGDKDPKDYANLDIEDAIYAELCIAVWQNNRTIPDHPYAGELMKEGIVPTPANLYIWGLKKFRGELRDYDPDFIKFNLFRRGVASITERGIKFRNWYYDCDKAHIGNWYNKASIQKPWTENICYDRRNMDNIYIINEDENTIDICTIKPECFFYKGKTLDEIEDYEKYKTINKTSIYTEHDNQNDLTLNEELKKVAKSAEKKNGGRKKNSKDMKQGIKENRKNEDSSYSKNQAIKIVQTEETMIYSEAVNEEISTSENYLYKKINKIREDANRND